jgi:hypothetical protein
MPDLVTKVCEWVADVCGSKTVTIGGTCGAAVMALYAMAASPRVGEVIAISCPFRTFDDQPGPRDKVRAGIAAIDSVGVRLMPALTRRQGTRGEESMWIDELISAVANTPAGVRVFFLYGANDSQYAEFLELQASGDVPREVMDRWDVEVYPADELYGYSKFVVRDWLASSIVDWVAPRGSSADA